MFFQLKLLTFVYDSMTMLAPSCFHGYFSLSSTVHNHATRESCRNDLYLIRKNTLRYGLGSIRYVGAKLWNELPREFRTSSSRFIFKKRITKMPTRNHMKLFTSKHLKNTILTSVKLMQMQFRKTGKRALFSLVTLLREFLLRIQLSYIRSLINFTSYCCFFQ